MQDSGLVVTPARPVGAGLRARVPAWARTAIRVVRSADERHDWLHELRRRRSGEPPLPTAPIRRVLVICHGNICRSPFAGADLALRNPGIEVRSAGLEAGEGNPPERYARSVADELGVDLAAHTSHRVAGEDIAWADLIVAMQGRHVASVRRRWPGAERSVRLLGDYLPSRPHMLEDPWGREAADFRSVFQRIAQANARLSELLRAGASR